MDTDRRTTWLDAFLSFFYPERCQICGVKRAVPDEGYVCETCRTQPGGVRLIAPPFCQRCGLPYEGDISGGFSCGNCREFDLQFDWARAATVATPLILDVIHRYKYYQATWFEPFLWKLLLDKAVPSIDKGGWDWIVPVPLHPLRRRERGFNQAQRLARRLSAATGIPLNESAVRRVEPTRTQTLLSRPQRHQNVRNAFAANRSHRLDHCRVLLVDDVLTTGSTTSACARTLRQSGAVTIGVWTVARGI